MATHKHQRSDSSFYRIYRRIRFIRYKKRLKKKQLKEFILSQRSEQEDIRRRLDEYKRTEAEQTRLKIKAEKKSQKRIKQDLEREFREREIQAKAEFERLSKRDTEKFNAENLAEKERRKLQYKQERIQRRHTFIQAIKSLTPPALYRTYKENAPKRKLYNTIFINSTVFFLLSYLLFYLTYQAVTVIVGYLFHYPTIVYYYEVYFNISSEAWYHHSVKSIYSSGPLALFILGLISLIIYNNLKELTGNFKLFFIWAFLHGVNMLFGALLIGNLFDTGIGYVLSWLYITDSGKVLTSTFSVFILIVTGMIVARPVMISGNHYFNEINRENRRLFVIFQMILPFLAGNIILIILRSPHFMYYETFMNFVLAIPLMAILASTPNQHDLYFEEGEKKVRIGWIFVVILAIVLFFYRGLLARGIHIGG